MSFQDYSFTGLWGQINTRFVGILGNGRAKLAPVGEPLPEAELDALADRLALWAVLWRGFNQHGDQGDDDVTEVGE